MALPGTLLPREASMSLHNQYWTLGWPIPLEVTVYGPSSGYSGMSIPFLPVLVCSFACWFVVAALSYRIWLNFHYGAHTFFRALVSGLVCIFWGLIVSCFVLGAVEFFMDWHWRRLGAQDLIHSVTNYVVIYPFFCLSILSAPLVIQVVASHGYPIWPRVAFCGISVLALVGLSSPLANRLNDSNDVGQLQIIRPVEYCSWKYEMNLELVNIISRGRVQGRQIPVVNSEGETGSQKP